MKIEFGYLATAAVLMNFIDEINAVLTTATLTATFVFWMIKNIKQLKQGKDPDIKPPVPPDASPKPIVEDGRGVVN